MCAAAGLHPFDDIDRPTYEPIKVAIFDCENSVNQVRRAARPLAWFVNRWGRNNATDRVFVRCTSRLDLTRDKDLASIHHELDAIWPDLVVIGPLYRLVPRALQNDDDAAPVLAALDSIRDRGSAILIEAHSGHLMSRGERDLRPRGSSALLGWPEFGYGMRRSDTKGYCGFEPWRGDRSERHWPERLRRTDDSRWVPVDTSMNGERRWPE